jgi:Ca-activated chloride channel homolog
MRKGILAIMMLGGLFGSPSTVQKAKEAFDAKNYKSAIALYQESLENYRSQATAIDFNIGQAWFLMDSTQKALSQYGKVSNQAKTEPVLASWAWNNVGCLQAAQPQAQSAPPAMGMSPNMPSQAGNAAAEQDPTAFLQQALESFKEALKIDHNNEAARYNYELIKRRLQQQQDQQQQNKDQEKQQDQQQQQDQNKNEQKQDGQNESPENKENKGDKQGEGETQEMTAQEAQRLLDAMNSNEKKFIQQIEKSKKHRVYEDDNGHDW